jgi:hypothetical protein
LNRVQDPAVTVITPKIIASTSLYDGVAG